MLDWKVEEAVVDAVAIFFAVLGFPGEFFVMGWYLL